MRFHHPKACSRLADVRSVRFDRRNAYKRLVAFWKVRFDHLKWCRRLADVRRVRLDYRKACKKLA